MGFKIHKKNKISNVRIGILSISTTRYTLSDRTGIWLAKKIIKKGNNLVFHKIIKDNTNLIEIEMTKAIKRNVVDSIILLGGTGLSKNDVTIEAVNKIFSKEISGFASIYSQISYQSIGASTMLSRAKAGIVNNKLVFCIPGSLSACKLICNKIIFKELFHIIFHIFS